MILITYISSGVSVYANSHVAIRRNKVQVIICRFTSSFYSQNYHLAKFFIISPQKRHKRGIAKGPKEALPPAATPGELVSRSLHRVRASCAFIGVVSMMLTVLEVAARLGISRTSLYQLIKSKQLPSHRFGERRGVIRISEEDLAAFIESCRDTGTAGASMPPGPVRLKHLTQ